MLAQLIAEYVRDVDGTYDVLRDALLERGLEPLPRGAHLVERLELVLGRLREADQIRVAAASVRRLAVEAGDAVRNRALQSQITEALAAAEAAGAPDVLRNNLFRSWQVTTGTARRIVWAAWMVLRGSPAIALATTRAVDPDEAEAQVGSVAEAFGRDLA